MAIVEIEDNSLHAVLNAPFGGEQQVAKIVDFGHDFLNFGWIKSVLKLKLLG